MKKTKSVLVYVIYLLFVIIFFSISSCSDNEVTVVPSDGPYQFDSTRYTWTTDTVLYQDGGQIFGFDSSHIYVMGPHAITFFDGKSQTRHNYGDLYFNKIDGFDPQHVYIAGGYPNLDYRLMKWDGSTFQDLPVPRDTNNEDIFTAILAKSENEIWLGTLGKIFLNKGNMYTEYTLDSAVGISDFVEWNGNLLAIGTRSYGEFNSDFEIDLYQFENNSWERIYQNRVHYYEKHMRPVKLGNQLYALLEGLLKFDGSDFHKVREAPTGFKMGYIAAGETDNDFLTTFLSDLGIFYSTWNGQNWSKEMYIESPQEMKKIGSNYYIIELPWNASNFVLLRTGKPNFEKF